MERDDVKRRHRPVDIILFHRFNTDTNVSYDFKLCVPCPVCLGSDEYIITYYYLTHILRISLVSVNNYLNNNYKGLGHIGYTPWPKLLLHFYSGNTRCTLCPWLCHINTTQAGNRNYGVVLPNYR